MPGVLIGGDARPAPGGVANFTGLAVFGIGGSGFQLRVQELLSKVVEATATFPVYPSSLALSRSTGAPHDVLAGDPLGRFVVSLLGAEGEILDSIQSVDNFTVIATAARISGDRQPVLLVGGPVSVIASAGNATFAMLAVPSVAGRVNVDFTFVRLGLSPLFISTSVRVFPNTLMVGDGGWGADGTVAVFVADAPITVNVTLLNIQGQPMTGVSAADNVTVRAYLLLQSAEAPAGSLRGLTEVAVDGGRAAFVLAVGGIVGTGFALRFELVALELGYDGVQLRNFSRPFNVVALELAIVPATPNVDAGGPLPTIEVQMLGLAGTPLNASLDFSLTAYLSTYVLRGCGTYAACSCPVLRTTTWAQCAAIAVRANTSRFALANRTCLVGPWVPPQAGVVIPYAASAAMPCNCSLGPATPEACDGVAAGTLDGSQRPLGGPGTYALYELIDATGFLSGRRSVSIGHQRAGVATFSGLSTTGRFGQAAVLMIFKANFSMMMLQDATLDFSVDPVRVALRGDLQGQLFNTTYRERAPIAGALLELLDNRSAPAVPFFVARAAVLPAYVVRTGLRHNGRDVTWALAGPVLQQRILNNSALFNNLSVIGAAGAGFSLTFEIPESRNKSLLYVSMPFTVLPTRLAIENPTVFTSTALASTLPTVKVTCRSQNGSVLTEIGPDDGMYVVATVLKGGPGGRNTSTLGTVRKLIIAGLVTFDDLSTLAAGVNFTVRFRLEYSGPQDGGLPVEVFSPLFVLSPKYLTIAAAISAPLVNPVVVDRTTFPGIGSYAIELEALDGSPVVDLSAEDGMFVTATILHNGNDETTKYLKGTLVRPAAYSAFNSIHAYFDDLELIRVGQNLTLEFALTAGPAVPGPVTNISYTLGPFKCVPFALKIFEQCYNGLAWNDSAMSTIDHQTSYVLDCSGVSPGLPSEQGQFGYLTGYYFFNDNQYIGPLMKSVRNESRVPTIQVLATGLNHSEVLTYIDLSDGIYVIASVFMENDINASLAGNTTQPVYEGGALFNDLVLHSGAHCVGGCPVSLRFTVVGAACTSCYCATVQLTMSAAPIIPPNQLGTHPAFPGQTRVQGNLTLQGIDLAHFETFLSVFVEALVLSVGDQRFVVENVHVTSAAAAATANAGVRIGFNVLPISYGVGTLVVSRLPAAFRTGFSQFLILACQKLGFSPVNTAICTATIPSNGWTAPIRQFTAF